ncbi:5-oxoprolinase subunit PxpA [Oceanobacillus halotolerans]|uniref:5-oxoprolinase subunit PxpA n=1 Tax=Oceanobacillus halotolerans TaxID=2663380 RepID=UPI0013DA707A|nr:5-oxoprolinase subunit PxpA [Oceanobacillus halotolerans]
MTRVDLNCDMGESFGAYSFGGDEAILNYITSANVACGFHAGDPRVMEETVRLAKEKHVAVGAHPGFPDLAGFGRRFMDIAPEEIYQLVAYQIGALQAFCKIHGVVMQHVKPHGALYNTAAKDRAIADAIARAVRDVDDSLILFGLAGGELVAAGRAAGLTVASEVFADRTYQPDGTLTSRKEANALIENVDTAVNQVVRMVKKGVVTAVNGDEVAIKADTVCVHGDGAHAIAFVEKLREVLTEAGVEVTSVGKK